MLNRSAIILKYKKAAVDWLNKVDPEPGNDISLDFVNSDRAVYLVSEDAAEDLDNFIKNNFEYFFENELFSWYTTEELWPKSLTLKLFNEWFNVECYSMVIDSEDNELLDDEDEF